MTVDRSDPKPGLKLSTMRFPVRWGELDAQGHVNNTVYLRYFEESRVLWGETLGLHLDGKGEGMILLKSSVTYRQQVGYPANIEVALFVGKIGRSSFNLINTGAGGGLLQGAGNSSNSNANLTAEGPIDWIHWGDNPLNRKAGVAPQISTFTVVGTGTVSNYGDDQRTR